MIDLRELRLPDFDHRIPPGMAHRQYASDAERDLGERFDAADALLVVTSEYNHGYPSALKNVLDHYFIELSHKPVAFVGYGTVGGSRGIEQLRQVVIELDMVPVRPAVHILGPQMLAIRQGAAPAEALAPSEDALAKVLDALTWWTEATSTARADSPA